MPFVNLGLRSALVCLFALSGCQTTSKGELLKVVATLSSSTCGAAVEVEDSEEFQVRIARSDDELTWYEIDSGDSIQGSISNGRFTLAEVEVFRIIEASGADPGCTVRRHDSYAGTITIVSDAITKMQADMVSSYSEADGFSCDTLIGKTGGFSDLPCLVKYSLEGTPTK